MKSILIAILTVMMVLTFAACNQPNPTPPPTEPPVEPPPVEPPPPPPPPPPELAQAPERDNAYDTTYRTFPNAPADGILTYPWGSGTDNYFDKNATVTYWNNKSHNHKYPDLFTFANGNKVKNIADWEERRKEIFAILQYYMHGRMPPIDEEVLKIEWEDTSTTATTITLTHLSSNRTATFNVTHTPPTGAVESAKDKILLFGVGQAPNADRHSGWGVAKFDTVWGGSEGGYGSTARSGTCATLYGLNVSADDTPSVNMEYAWAMSVILTVIEEGGLKGYYDPEKVGIYGFSRYGKAAMCIGAFAASREGKQLGQTFIGSAGSGGPALDRFFAQAGYKDFTEDSLPLTGSTQNVYSNLKGITWYQQKLSDTSAAGANNRGVIRGWTKDTPGIPEAALIYGEKVDYTALPYVKSANAPSGTIGLRGDFGGIQNLSQARNETAGWFSNRFKSFSDLHNGLDLDHDDGQPGRGKEGVLCTMPFDAHFITALIAPRIVYYEDGYQTTRNNPEAQWANWLICDEIYQMYAEEKNDPSIIWRNAIKMYHIPHAHQTYQDQDEYDLTTAIYAGTQPDAKFRTPPFPVDDPRYRWDFNRMDIGRPGEHPTIAKRVWLMRTSTEKVKAMDTRGLLDKPEKLEE